MLNGLNMQKTSRKIRMLCEKKGLSVRDVQAAMYLSSRQSVYRWFSEDDKSLPTIDHLVTLASILGCTVDEMLVTEPIY